MAFLCQYTSIFMFMEVFVQNSSIYCIFWLPSVTDHFNPNNQFPDQICYSNTLPLVTAHCSIEVASDQLSDQGASRLAPGTLQHSAALCSTLQHSAVVCSVA